MCASGLPTRNGNKHASELADMALHVIDAIKTFRIPHLPEEKLEVRIGINTGKLFFWEPRAWTMLSCSQVLVSLELLASPCPDTVSLETQSIQLIVSKLLVGLHACTSAKKRTNF